MNALTLDTDATATRIKSGVVFRVEATGAGKSALHSMVPSHAPELAKATGWMVDAEINENGVTLSVRTDVAADIVRIRALGFYGLMALGTHHQTHHLQLASGISTH